jgi:ubiquitin-conjugating enzyme E2 J2
MLSDEMTTGSVTTTDAYKRIAAAKSHRFNLESPRFKEAFPDVSHGYCSFMTSVKQLLVLYIPDA